VRLKGPGLHQAEMLQALGHGAEGTCYFQWRRGRGGCEMLHGAVVDHVGHEHTRVFQTVAEVGALYPKLASILGSTVPSQVALLYDWEVRWAFEATSGVRSVDDAYWTTALEHYRAFWKSGVNVDVLATEQDWSGVPTGRGAAALDAQARRGRSPRRLRGGGGCCVATYYLGATDPHNRCHLGGHPGEGLGGSSESGTRRRTGSPTGSPVASRRYPGRATRPRAELRRRSASARSCTCAGPRRWPATPKASTRARRR